jgi:micrococcal nuclease
MQNLARCTRVIDGDTFEAVIDLGFYISLKITVRLYGVNCPEMHPKNDAAEAAKAYVISRIENKDIHIWSYKKDSFGRWLCDVLVDGLLLSKEIIDQGYGVPYFGDRLGDNHE